MGWHEMRVWLYLDFITILIPGVSALENAVIGVIIASSVMLIFIVVAISFTACYCQGMLKKRRRGKNKRMLPGDHSTISTVAGYTTYAYPDAWYYTDSRYYQHSKRLAVHRPKVLVGEGVPSEPKVTSDDRDREDVKHSSGHPITGIDLKVLRKSQKRLSDWLNTNYDENMVSIDLGREDDDIRETLTAEQFLAQNVPARKISTYKDDGEFVIVDYVDVGNEERRRKSSSAPPHAFERQPDPLPPASMPYLYKSTIGVVQDKTANRIENSEPVSLSSPVRYSPRGDNHVFIPTIADGDLSQNSNGMDYNSDGTDDRYHRQRTSGSGSLSELPPGDSDNYREFMTSRTRTYE